MSLLYLEPYLPTSTWSFLLLIALLNTVLLLLHFTQHYKTLSILDVSTTYSYLILCITTVLTIDTYLTLSTAEQSYMNHTSDKSSGFASSRFRAQRNFYLSFFSLILSVVLLLTTRLVQQRDQLQGRVYQLQRSVDESKSR